MTSAHPSTITWAHAVRYPLQGARWGQRLLVLTLLQFIPIVGQAMLAGYGMAVARSVSAGQYNLPPLSPVRATGDGLRLLLAGLLYIAPILLVVPTLLTIGFTRPDEAGSSANLSFVFVTFIAAMVIVPLLRQLPARYQAIKSVILGLAGIVPVLMIISMVASVINNPMMFDIQGAQLNGIGMALIVVLAGVSLIALIALHVSGLRYAVQGRGLLDPTGSIHLMLQQRAATAVLILNLAVLLGAGGVIIMLGLPFVIPAAFTLVMTTLAIWYILAHYSRFVYLP